MNYRRPASAHKSGSDEVNITPVMNLFLVLIPFLLLSAEFVRIAVLELNLPSTAAAQDPSKTKKDDKPMVLIMVRIEDGGFEIKAGKLAKSRIPMKDNSFQFDALENELRKIKQQYPGSEEITVQPTDSILYEIIVKVMDTCRDNGFPSVSISA